MRVVVITDQLPYPLISGDRVRIYNLLRRVAALHDVWLLSLADREEELQAVPHLLEFCRRVETARIRRRSPVAHLPGLLRFAVAGRPPELKFAYSDDLARGVQDLVWSVDPDIVQFEHSKMALYLDAVPRGVRAKRVLVFHNVSSDQYRRISQIGQRPVQRVRASIHSAMMRRWEPRAAERADCCVAMSEVEKGILEVANPRARVRVIPNGVDTKAYQPLPRESGSSALLYVGKMNYAPGADGAIYFTREVLPRVRALAGGLDLWIVGTDPPPGVRALAGDGVHVTGRVDSVVPYYQRSAACVVPLRAGGGTRLKILEAMALGRPVVSTSIGAEGLDVVDGEHILIADSEQRFAEQTVRLLRDERLYERITSNARQLVVSRYDWDAIAGQQLQMYSDLAAADALSARVA